MHLNLKKNLNIFSEYSFYKQSYYSGWLKINVKQNVFVCNPILWSGSNSTDTWNIRQRHKPASLGEMLQKKQAENRSPKGEIDLKMSPLWAQPISELQICTKCYLHFTYLNCLKMLIQPSGTFLRSLLWKLEEFGCF